MACGVPCVVTDVGNSAQIVGDEGIVVPPGNSQMLANGVDALLLKLNALSAFEIRGRIVKQFSLEAMIDATENALTELRLTT